MNRSCPLSDPRTTTVILAGLFVLVTFCQGFAQAMYVKPTTEVPLRSGQGSGYKIVAIIADGTPVTALEEETDWTKIRLTNGKEGWILTRYLSRELPLREQVERLQEQKASTADQQTTLQEKLDEVTAANAQTEQELTACIIERDTIRTAYTTLQADTADVVQTQKDLAAAVQERDMLAKDLETARLENSQLKKNSALKWFLAGGGVLLFGWILGLVTTKSKKRRSSLL